MFRSVTIGILVILLTMPSRAQTLVRTVEAENPGDRYGTALLRIAPWPDGATLLSGCQIMNVLVSGTPEWSSGTGRVELWNPYALITNRITFATGDAPGDRFGAALAGPADLGGTGYASDFVVGAPGTAGGSGRVRVYASSTYQGTPCETMSPTPLWSFDGGPGDGLGHSVAVIGDVDGDGRADVAAGAPYDDNSTPFGTYTDAGRIFILSGNTGALIRTHTTSQAQAHLGWAVAGVGDVNGDGTPDYAGSAPDRDVSGLVGAPDADIAGGPFGVLNIGRLELRSGANGSVLVSASGGSGSFFGAALAGGSDLDQDGVPDFVAGAPGSASLPGRVEVWSGRTLTMKYRLDGLAFEGFGSSVCVRGTEFCAGAPFAPTGGRARWYDAEIDWNLPESWSSYGSSLAVLGDVDQDGVEDLAIGRYRHSGVTYSSSNWHIRSGRTSQVLFEETGPAPKGHALAALGDVNGDGRDDLAVGDPGNDTVTIRSGAAPATVLRTIQVPNAGTFGHALAGAGDTDGDGVSDLLIGDPEHFLPIGIGVTGRATLVSGATGAVIRHHVDAGDGDQAGWAVAGLGDVDGDGRDDYAVGIPRYRQAGIGQESGAARVYSGMTGALLVTLLGGSFQAGHAGTSVCGPGDLDGDGFAEIVVGEPDWSGTLAQQGRVMVLGGGPQPNNVILFRNGTAAGHRFGHALAPLGDVDRDGSPDFAVSRLAAPGGPGAVYAVSGATGGDVFLHPGAQTVGTACYGARGEVLAGQRDPGPDGRSELLVGSPSPSVGASWACLYELPRAQATYLGAGCGSGPPSVGLNATSPRLGRFVTFTLSNPPAGSCPAELYASLPPAQDLPIGFGCTVFLDLASLVPVATIPHSGGNASITVWLPDAPVLAGIRLRFQVALAYNFAPLGFALSPGLETVFGF